MYGIDLETASELFVLCNEYASRLTVQGNFAQAQVLIEQALLLSKFMPLKIQSCLLSNISCFYERKNEMKTARLYYEHAIQLWKRASQEQAGRVEGTTDSDSLLNHSEKHLSYEEALSDAINQAINYNNLSVIELRDKNFSEATQAAKNALNCIETKLMDFMNKTSALLLKSNPAFVENLMVLLVAYFNYGMCQLKKGMKSKDSTLSGQILKALEEGN